MIRIAVASGKGGTGKTTVATSLALALDTNVDTTIESTILFLDCDVEAPNAHLYLNPAFERREDVGILIPEIDEARCTYCNRCAEVCEFHAIAVIGQKTLVFPELCHGCGSCTLICPEDAISERLNVTGILEGGPTPTGVSFAHGVMNVGEPMAVPIIRQLKKWSEGIGADWTTVILDVPPGTSCPVVESIQGADFVILVTEPTPFGLHDLRLAVQLTRELDIPAGVIVNRDGIGNTEVNDYCREESLPVLMRIPLDRQIGVALAQGQPLVSAFPEYLHIFRSLYSQILSLVGERQENIL